MNSHTSRNNKMKELTFHDLSFRDTKHKGHFFSGVNIEDQESEHDLAEWGSSKDLFAAFLLKFLGISFIINENLCLVWNYEWVWRKYKNRVRETNNNRKEIIHTYFF